MFQGKGFVCRFNYRIAIISAALLAFTLTGLHAQVFAPPVNVSGENSNAATPRIAVDSNGNVDVVWLDDSVGTPAVFFSRSSDGGQTFTNPLNISNHAGSPAESERVAVDAAGDIYVVWSEDSSGAHTIFLSRSTDYGLSFSVPQKISEDSDATDPGIAIDTAGGINLLWLDKAAGQRAVFFSRSTDPARTFSVPTALSNAEVSAGSPQLIKDSTGPNEMSTGWAASGSPAVRFPNESLTSTPAPLKIGEDSPPSVGGAQARLIHESTPRAKYDIAAAPLSQPDSSKERSAIVAPKPVCNVSHGHPQIRTANANNCNSPIGTSLQAAAAVPPSNTSTQYVDCVHYSCSPDIGAGITAAIAALPPAGGEIVIPAGSFAQTSQVNVSKQVIIGGAGGPGINGSTSINFTGTGAMFSLSTGALGFRLHDVQITGSANPAVAIPSSTANGQVYEIDHCWFVVSSGVQIGTSSPFLLVHDNHFRDSQFDVSVGGATDGDIFRNFFDSDLITTAQAHVLLQAGASDVRIRDNTFLGTNTTSPDIIQYMIGGMNSNHVEITGNKFGNEQINGAPERILFSYSGSGTAVWGYGSISGDNYFSNSQSGSKCSVPDVIRLSSNNIGLLQDHFDGNVLSSGPNTGYFLDNPPNAPLVASTNTADDNAIINNTFLGTLNSTNEFSSWTATTASNGAWTRFNTGPSRSSEQIADQGTACTDSELALSGWGSAVSVSGAAGTGQTCRWMITSGGTAQQTDPTIADTLTNPLPSPSTICTMAMEGGTGNFMMISQTTLSATDPVFTLYGTPVADHTYIVNRRCGP